MKPVTLYDRSGLVVTAKGDFTREEVEILQDEVRLTISSILKGRKYRGEWI